MERGDQVEVLRDNGPTIMVTFHNAATCKSCGAEIWWCVTERGRNMPVDPTDDDEPTLSHFATCVSADQWRTRKGR